MVASGAAAASSMGGAPGEEASFISALKSEVLTYTAMNGLLMLESSDEVGLVHVPVSLLPAMAVPRGLFEEVRALAEPFNVLVERFASDPVAIKETLAAAAKQDEFTRDLIRVYDAVLGGPRPSVARKNLAVNRSDYMMDQQSQRLLQVELNTISSSFGAQSTILAQMHRQILGKFDFLRQSHRGLWPGGSLLEESEDAASAQSRVPYQDTIGDIVDAFAAAAGEYRGSRGSALGPGGAVVLMVVQDDERNVMDQQILEQELWRRHGVRMERRTLAQVAEEATLGEADGILRLGDGREVAVSYLRAGYSPADYKGAEEWEARLMLEQSEAFKCPSIAYQLVGSKKIQQYLAEEGALERFMGKGEESASLRRCFASLWGLEDLGDPKTKEVIDHAKKNPHLYVLKPQREGGGNNLYDEELREALEGEGDLSAYILMQRIVSPMHKSYLLRKGECVNADTLSELGIYGVYLCDNGREIINKCSGALVRTKLASSNEGGVTAGFSCLSTPILH